VVTRLLRSGPLIASTVVESFRSSTSAGKAPATIALRLAAIRCPFRIAYDNGLVGWQFRVRAPKVEAYRDTRGPGLDAVRRLFATARKIKNPLVAARDAALVHLLFTLALRREEASALRVEHYDRAGRLWIKGKGRSERTPLSLPDDARAAIEHYLSLRSPVDLDAPLLASHTPDHTRSGDGRLTGNGIYQRVRHLAKKANLEHPARPHGLRHTAITTALDATRDPRVVQRFSRHKKIETVMKYDDNRADLGGAVAVQLAELARPKGAL
jgi:integrase/recombinase XerC